MHIHIWHIHIWHIHIYTRICTYTHYIAYTHLRIYTSMHIHAYTIYHTKWVYEIGPVPQRSHRLKLGNPKDRIYDITIHSSSDTPKRNAHFRSTLSHTFGISSGDFPENPWFGTSQKSGLGTAHVPKKMASRIVGFQLSSSYQLRRSGIQWSNNLCGEISLLHCRLLLLRSSHTVSTRLLAVFLS